MTPTSPPTLAQQIEMLRRAKDEHEFRQLIESGGRIPYGAILASLQQLEAAHSQIDGLMKRLLTAEGNGLQRAWNAIDNKIVRGPLPGNGCDQTAQRNGMILASNLVMELISQQGGGDG